MKLILSPSIYLISKPDIDREEIARFLAENNYSVRFSHDHERPAEQLSATASRTCYQSFDSGRSPDDHIKHLVSVSHGSVFAHANYSILATGISRSLTHELIRHHVGTAVSQLSQRFVDDPEDISFVVPPALVPVFNGHEVPGRGYLDASYEEDCKRTINSYRYWLNVFKDMGRTKKQAAEAARCKLTNDVETRVVFTGNIRAWRNIWEQRCTESADAEIRRFACAVFLKLQPHMPTILADYTRTELPDGSFTLHTEHRKI